MHVRGVCSGWCGILGWGQRVLPRDSWPTQHYVSRVLSDVTVVVSITLHTITRHVLENQVPALVSLGLVRAHCRNTSIV